MKKLILLLSMFLCVMVGAKTLTDSEKKEMLRQFSEFQQVVRNEDTKTLVTMMKFPFEDSGQIMPGDNIEPMTKQDVFDYSSSVFDFLSDLTFLSVDLDNMATSGYIKEGNACSLGYQGKFVGDELWIVQNFIPHLSSSCSGGYDVRFKLVSKKLKLVGVNAR